MLREAGIPFEVVPGITAGIAAPAYAGIPVTHRELASGVAFVTGHEDGTLDWDALAAFPGTLVFYMGVKALPRIAERLVAGGRPPDQPVAVVERGTLPGQKTVVATLADVASATRRAFARRRSRWSATSPGCASRSHGSSRGRCSAAPSRSPARARRRRRWRSGCADLGADVVEAPAIRTRRSRSRCRTCRRTTCCASPRRPARRELFDAPARRARPGRRDRRRDRAGHGARAALAWHRGRHRAGARGRRRAGRGAGRRAGAARIDRARGRGAATSCRTRCVRAALRSTSWRCTRPSPSRSRRKHATPRRPRTTCCSRRRRRCGSSRGRRLVDRPEARLDRARDERGRCASTAPSRTSRPTRTRRTALIAALLPTPPRAIA